MATVLVVFLFTLHTVALPLSCAYADISEELSEQSGDSIGEISEEISEVNPEEENPPPGDPEDPPDDDPEDPPGDEPEDPPDDDPENPPDDEPEDPPDDEPEDPPDDEPEDPPEDDPEDSPDDDPECLLDEKDSVEEEQEAEPEDISESDEGDPTEEAGETELTWETDNWLFKLVSDIDAVFPADSGFTVRELTEEDEQWPEYIQELQEVLSPEETLFGIFEISWDFPESDFPDEDLCLFLFLLDTESDVWEGALYIMEEEVFILSEDAEWDEESFFLRPARSGLIALTLSDPPPDEEDITDDPVPKATTDEIPEKSELSEPAEAPKDEISIPAEKLRSAELTETKADAQTKAGKEEKEEPVSLRASPPSIPTIQRNIHRYRVAAADLADTDVDHVVLEILDPNGIAVAELELSDNNEWQDRWDTEDSASGYTIREKKIFSKNGDDVTAAWNPQLQPAVTQTFHESSADFDHPEDLTDGSYVISFMDGESQYLLAASGQRTRKNADFYYWPLSVKSSAPETAPDCAVWHVESRGRSFLIRNAAVGNDGYLSAKLIKDVIRFVVIEDFSSSQPTSLFSNGYLKASGGASVLQCLVAGADGYSTVPETEIDQATTLTLHRYVAFYEDTVHESAVTIRHTPRPPTVSVSIELNVSDNLGERDKTFPFSVRINDEEFPSFSLADGDQHILQEVPVGAELCISMTAEADFTVTSAFPGLENGKESMSILSVPDEGGTVSFSAVRKVELNTGLRLDNNGLCIPLLFAVFLYFAIKPFIKYQINKMRSDKQ